MIATDSESRVHTTAGLVEAEVSGSGIPILILHASPGGIDAARSMSHFLDKDRFKTICLSRPGYLNTPLSAVHRSIDVEADLIVALLDVLRIPRAGVLAWSGGGPVAYQLASRDPHRVSALVCHRGCKLGLDRTQDPYHRTYHARHEARRTDNQIHVFTLARARD